MATKIKITHPHSGKGGGRAWRIAILIKYLGRVESPNAILVFNSGQGLMPTPIFRALGAGKMTSGKTLTEMGKIILKRIGSA